MKKWHHNKRYLYQSKEQDLLVYTHTDGTDTQTDGQTDRQTHRQMDRQNTDVQTHIQMDRHAKDTSFF